MSLQSRIIHMASTMVIAARCGLDEISLIKDFNDVGALLRKAIYLLHRASGLVKSHQVIPPSLQIEPTNYCNISCFCCSAKRSTRLRGHMDYILFTRIIDEAASIGVKRIHLYLHGEPMLHPRIADMVRYVKRKNLSVNITTNGMSFSQNQRAELLNSGLDLSDHITFSILGGSKDTHEAIMKGVSHEQVVDHILGFVDQRRELAAKGPIIETMFYPMLENQHEIGAYLSFWRDKVDHARMGGEISTSFMSYGQKNFSVPRRSATCKNIWERMTIYWDGRVTLCCEDLNAQVILGDLTKDTITDIWNSEQLLRIKELHRHRQFKEFPFCESCDM